MRARGFPYGGASCCYVAWSVFDGRLRLFVMDQFSTSYKICLQMRLVAFSVVITLNSQKIILSFARGPGVS